MITVRVCTEIDAPLDQVWAAVERIETHSTWMKDAVRITFESEQRSGVGAAFECLTRVGPLHTTDHFVVTRWEPPRLMGIDHRGAVTGDADFRLRAVDDDPHRVLLGGTAAVPVVDGRRRSASRPAGPCCVTSGPGTWHG